MHLLYTRSGEAEKCFIRGYCVLARSQHHPDIGFQQSSQQSYGERFGGVHGLVGTSFTGERLWSEEVSAV